MKQADLALYEAKDLGRNRIVTYDEEFGRRFDARQQLFADVDRALAADRFVAVYQPCICLQSERVVGFEALVRWNDGSNRLAGPGNFRQVFEDADYATRISDTVLRQAIADAGECNRRELPFERLSVNVTELQLIDPQFTETLTALLARHGLAPNRLTIEVTERVLLSRHDTIIKERLAELSSLGIGISLDDFGTGFASLTQLHRFAIDSVKIDHSIIGGIEHDEMARIIASGIVRMVHDLGLDVVAEGVEDAGIDAVVRELGFDFAQGFFHAEPMRIEELAEWCEQRAPLRIDHAVTHGDDTG